MGLRTISIKLVSAVQRHDSICHIPISAFHQSHFLHHFLQLLLIKEPLNALNQVLVGAFIPSDHAAHLRDHGERVFVVDLPKYRVYNLAKLKAHKSAAFLQNPLGFLECSACSGHVSQTERYGVCIKGVVGKGEFLSVAANELDFYLNSLIHSLLRPIFFALTAPSSSMDWLISNTMALMSTLGLGVLRC